MAVLRHHVPGLLHGSLRQPAGCEDVTHRRHMVPLHGAAAPSVISVQTYHAMSVPGQHGSKVPCFTPCSAMCSACSWGGPAQQSPAEAVRDAQQAAWERLYLSRDMHDERNSGLLWLAAVTLIALWATGILNPPAHDPLDAGA